MFEERLVVDIKNGLGISRWFTLNVSSISLLLIMKCDDLKSCMHLFIWLLLRGICKNQKENGR